MGKETSRKNTKNFQESAQGLNHFHLCLKGHHVTLTYLLEKGDGVIRDNYSGPFNF